MRAAARLLMLALVSGSALFVAGARRATRAPKEPRGPTASIGDAIDVRSNDPNYIGHGWQAVSVITPMSSGRRTLTRDGKFVGSSRRRGLVTWIKKHDRMPWEKPWDDPAKAPFKLRFLRQDPAGVALALAQEGKLELAAARVKNGRYQGRRVLQMRLVKPKPWYRKFF